MPGLSLFKRLGIWRHPRLTIFAILLVTVTCSNNSALAQKQGPPSSQLERKLDEQSRQQTDDVVRVRTDLVQTSVAVFDKGGKFIGNLSGEDFELRIDGKASQFQFFDRVVNGVADESLTRNDAKISTSLTAASGAEATRTVLFFIDDLHLSAESIVRTKNMLSHYIEQEMQENDEAVIASATGQIGFLQQLTRERDVLRAAVSRLTYRAQTLIDNERPRMTVYQALAIERGDEDVRAYFEEVLLSNALAGMLRSNQSAARDAAERMTRDRASRLIHQADAVATQTLAALSSAVRSSSQVTGRKLFVFVSDGFLVNNQNTGIRDRLQRITDAAVHAGAVVYTIQASGLNTAFPDASADVIATKAGDSGRVGGEDIATQDPLTQLAADTGGKALLNANDLNQSVKRALQESNNYYLLSWRPPTEDSGTQFHRIEVSVKGRPELSVLVQRGFFNDEPPPAAIRAVKDKPKAAGSFPLEELAAAIKGKLDRTPLPIYLIANYLDLPVRGATLAILMRVEKKTETNGKTGTIDVAGVVYNESGGVAGSFVSTLKPETNTADRQHVNFLDQLDVKPGLYQVRVAARDSGGLTGTAMQWVKVPDLSSHNLALSSLLIGQGELTESNSRSGGPLQKAQLKIDRRFAQGSKLRLLAFIYNVSRGANNQTPHVNARIDVFHGNSAAVSTPAFLIDTKNVEDAARIPYAGELNLASLASGHYRIRLTVIDLNAKSYASQEGSFEIE